MSEQHSESVPHVSPDAPHDEAAQVKVLVLQKPLQHWVDDEQETPVPSHVCSVPHSEVDGLQ